MSLGQTLQALADPTRRQIVQLLRERDLTAGEIAAHFSLAKPSISHHLSVLKNAGLVVDEKRGQYVYYSLNMSVLEELISWLIANFAPIRDNKQTGV